MQCLVVQCVVYCIGGVWYGDGGGYQCVYFGMQIGVVGCVIWLYWCGDWYCVVYMFDQCFYVIVLYGYCFYYWYVQMV